MTEVGVIISMAPLAGVLFLVFACGYLSGYTKRRREFRKQCALGALRQAREENFRASVKAKAHLRKSYAE